MHKAWSWGCSILLWCQHSIFLQTAFSWGRNYLDQSLKTCQKYCMCHWGSARSAYEQPNHSCCHIKEYCNHAHAHHYTYNMKCLLGFLETLNRDLRLENEAGLVKGDLANYVVVWADVSFYHTTLTSTWFTDHPQGVELPPTYHRGVPHIAWGGWVSSPDHWLGLCVMATAWDLFLYSVLWQIAMLTVLTWYTYLALELDHFEWGKGIVGVFLSGVVWLHSQSTVTYNSSGQHTSSLEKQTGIQSEAELCTAVALKKCYLKKINTG